ncbi:uncharacterized protein LOC132598726 [Lycium barbarum]|uniref:uncharacterized protein LOC132598726 n=1 Tax=Lycium barbarum TaxID=112863 RepID=UPI00293E13D8|nr:uncharacterized protein LOC132598726 [Lycium barbarum]XP_060167746.1 uncharacterized protein LOC132598726 [Lycium barbarum]XP_060167748.1 uncharacterized protein LOC132598726 [Lycium barbarum]XP_060167749.1 uncharacterized protein LOC132598726 [Lycium barbarum]XP_060167750.1 uncharacterized protein LOC132598726 [Lycium barbarum]XP_060167751.1 uncharacterized protein LOC132598726 [Lycium barbarum]XP_060167752.1 uncharacterized protein LOC132598726 [Lycium barbarum]XP_060167753.1 uncharacte
MLKSCLWSLSTGDKMCCLSSDLFLLGTLSGFQRGYLSASPNKSLICYSLPCQDKLKSHSVQQPLLQLLAFGHHELRDAASSQKVKVEVHTGGCVSDNWIDFQFGESFLAIEMQQRHLFFLSYHLAHLSVAIDPISCI